MIEFQQMAGTRQHINPKQLLKGFASKVGSKQTFTWVFPKDRQPYEATIRKVSVERYFYGEPGEATADEKITELENRVFDGLLIELREKDDGTEIFNPEIPEFVTHLSLRTKHLRDALGKSTEYLVEQILDRFFSHRHFQSLPKTAIQEIDRGRDYLRKVVRECLKESHNKELFESPNPIPRSIFCEGLRWFIYKTQEPMILGDFGPLYEIYGQRRFKTLPDPSDEIINVFLPIGSHKVLVGTSKPQQFKLDRGVLNEAIAKSSKDFFICSSISSYYNNLHKIIGMEAEIISVEELDKIVRQRLP